MTNGYLKKVISNILGEKDSYSPEELATVESIVIERNIDFNELKELPNLKEVKVFDLNLTVIELGALSFLENLKSLYFINCDIDSLKALSGLELDTLYIDNCVVEGLEYINNMTINSLYLENLDTVDLDDISVIRNIENISFNNTTVLNEEKLIYLDKIVNLSLANTEIKKIDTLIANETLKCLVIDEDIYKNNVEEVKELNSRGVRVVDMMNQTMGV